MAAGAAEATTDALEHVWRLLPDLLMQSIDTQALEALNAMHATALGFAEATLSVSDDLAHHRASGRRPLAQLRELQSVQPLCALHLTFQGMVHKQPD